MTKVCFVLPPWGEVGIPLILSEEEEHHLFRVRRVREGEEVLVLDGCGVKGHAVVRENKLVLESIEQCPPPRPPSVHVHAALLKSSNWEWLLEKLGELGVDTIEPILTAYVEKGHAEAFSKKQVRYQRFLTDAMKQSQNPYCPKLLFPREFNICLPNDEASSALHLVAIEPSASKSAGEIPKNLNEFKDIHLWLGPEGGWETEELERLTQPPFQPLQFKHRVFRAETAALFFVSNILYSKEYGRV